MLNRLKLVEGDSRYGAVGLRMQLDEGNFELCRFQRAVNAWALSLLRALAVCAAAL